MSFSNTHSLLIPFALLRVSDLLASLCVLGYYLNYLYYLCSTTIHSCSHFYSQSISWSPVITKKIFWPWNRLLRALKHLPLLFPRARRVERGWTRLVKAQKLSGKTKMTRCLSKLC